MKKFMGNNPQNMPLPADENISIRTPYLLLLAVMLTIAASLYTPVIFKPVSVVRCPCNLPYPLSNYVTVSAIDAPIISLGMGDNWPSTWADDDALYTYFADGTGFALSPALSMAPAKVLGNPASGGSGLSGQNIATTAIGKGTGGGASGRKVSGLLALPDATSPSGEVLYAWVRNITTTGGASLMYSYDHAASWAWAWGDPHMTSSAIIPELGYPTWMQAGKNNRAAQDGYVYFYSQDTPTAYQVANAVILGRVDKAHTLEKSAYQYVAGIDNGGKPIWSSNIALRKPVFSAQRQSYRVFVTYHPLLKRYFLLTANGDGLNSNWRVGHATHNLGIYEAPQPWGPWHTVYYNDHFQSVFAPQMVSKWLAADGRSFYLLYSSLTPTLYKFNIQKVYLMIK